MKLVLIGATLYMKPDTEFWKSVAGNKSNASAVIALLGDRVSQASGERRQRGGDRRRL